MNCPICGVKTRVVNTRTDGVVTARKRRCKGCKITYYTLEQEGGIRKYLELESKYQKAYNKKEE